MSKWADASIRRMNALESAVRSNDLDKQPSG